MNQNPKTQWKENPKLKKAGTVEQAARKSQACIKKTSSTTQQKQRAAIKRSKSSVSVHSKAGQAGRPASEKGHFSRSRSSTLRTTNGPGKQINRTGPTSGALAGGRRKSHLKYQNLVEDPESYQRTMPLRAEAGLSPYCVRSHSMHPDAWMQNSRAWAHTHEDYQTVSSQDRHSHR